MSEKHERLTGNESLITQKGNQNYVHKVRINNKEIIEQSVIPTFSVNGNKSQKFHFSDLVVYIV